MKLYLLKIINAFLGLKILQNEPSYKSSQANNLYAFNSINQNRYSNFQDTRIVPEFED